MQDYFDKDDKLIYQALVELDQEHILTEVKKRIQKRMTHKKNNNRRITEELMEECWHNWKPIDPSEGSGFDVCQCGAQVGWDEDKPKRRDFYNNLEDLRDMRDKVEQSEELLAPFIRTLHSILFSRVYGSNVNYERWKFLHAAPVHQINALLAVLDERK